MAILSITKDLYNDEYLMRYIRRSFDTMQELIYLPTKVVCRVTGPLLPSDLHEISPVMVSTGKGAVLINNMDTINFYPN